MSIEVADGRIAVSGHAAVEDAEPLLAALLDHPDCAIDVSGLRQAHLAVVQLLHAAQRPVIGSPDDPFLRQFALVDLLSGDKT